MKSNPSELLEDWLRRVKKAQIAYTRSATYLEKQHYWLGTSIIILSTLTAAFLFSTDFWIKAASSVMSIVAAILAFLQTFFRLSERAEKCRITGVKYGELRMEIEQKMFFQPQGEELERYADSVLSRWNRIREEAPTAPQNIWDKTVVNKKGRFIDCTKGENSPIE